MVLIDQISKAWTWSWCWASFTFSLSASCEFVWCEDITWGYHPRLVVIHQQQSGHLSSSHHHINIANIISSSFTANTNNNGYRALHFGCSHRELSAVESILFLLETLSNKTSGTDCSRHWSSSNPRSSGDNKAWTLHPVTLLPAIPRVVRAWHQPIRSRGWV